MSEARRSESKVPQLLDKQAPGHGETRAARHERHQRDNEAAEADEQGVLDQQQGPSIDIFSQHELKTLLSDTTRTCVSIYLPTSTAGAIPQNMTLLKNLMRSAEHQLIELGMDQSDVTNLMIPVQELLERLPFWQTTHEGLAVFRSPELFRVYRVPQTFQEVAMVADHFHIKPMLPLLTGEGRFYILTLSQHNIRLLRGNRERIHEVMLEGVPTNMADALNEEPERHAYNRNTAFGAGQQFHGHSQAKEDTDDRLNRFFHMVDKGLHNYLKDEKAPLVIAGVEYLFPIYKQANTYGHLLEEGIHGNPELLSPAELHERAWPLVEPHFLEVQQQAVTRYQEAKAIDNLTSQSLLEIVPAAAFGRVDTLFTTIGAEQRGLFDADANEVHLHETPEVGDEDLYNFAAMQTLLHSGTVYALPAAKMPDNVIVAALFRF